MLADDCQNYEGQGPAAQDHQDCRRDDVGQGLRRRRARRLHRREKVLDQKDDFIDIVRGVIEMAVEFDDDE